MPASAPPTTSTPPRTRSVRRRAAASRVQPLPRCVRCPTPETARNRPQPLPDAPLLRPSATSVASQSTILGTTQRPPRALPPPTGVLVHDAGTADAQYFSMVLNGSDSIVCFRDEDSAGRCGEALQGTGALRAPKTQEVLLEDLLNSISEERDVCLVDEVPPVTSVTPVTDIMRVTVVTRPTSITMVNGCNDGERRELRDGPGTRWRVRCVRWPDAFCVTLPSLPPTAPPPTPTLRLPASAAATSPLPLPPRAPPHLRVSPRRAPRRSLTT